MSIWKKERRKFQKWNERGITEDEKKKGWRVLRSAHIRQSLLDDSLHPKKIIKQMNNITDSPGNAFSTLWTKYISWAGNRYTEIQSVHKEIEQFFHFIFRFGLIRISTFSIQYSAKVNGGKKSDWKVTKRNKIYKLERYYIQRISISNVNEHGKN